MSKISEAFNRGNIKGAVSLVAAVVMYFTPDHIDSIIEGLLAAFGVSQLILKGKE